MDPSRARTHAAAAAAAAASNFNSAHSPPTPLALYDQLMPSMVQQTMSFAGRGVSNSPCPYMAVAYGAPLPAAASTAYSLGNVGGSSVTASSYPLPHAHLPSAHGRISVAVHTTANHLSSPVRASSVTGAGAAAGSYMTRCSTSNLTTQPSPQRMGPPAMIPRPSTTGNSFFNLRSQPSAMAVTSSASPNLSGRLSDFNNARFLQELDAAIAADRNRQHQQQQHHLATRRQSALSQAAAVATAALSLESSGRESPPPSVEELALDVSSLEEALASASTSLSSTNSQQTSSFYSPSTNANSNISSTSASASQPAVQGLAGVTARPASTRVASSTRGATMRVVTRSASRAARAQESTPQVKREDEQHDCERRNTSATNMHSHSGTSSSTSARSSRVVNPYRSSSHSTSSHMESASCAARAKKENSPSEDGKDKKPSRSSSYKKDSSSPSSKTSTPDKEEDEGSSDVSCCICMDIATKLELASINSCKHKFCFTCIEKWADRENTCPLCKERFTKIERVNKPPAVSRKRKSGDGPNPPSRCRNSKRVKNRSQRADFVSGHALQGLLGEFIERKQVFIASAGNSKTLLTCDALHLVDFTIFHDSKYGKRIPPAFNRAVHLLQHSRRSHGFISTRIDLRTKCRRRRACVCYGQWCALCRPVVLSTAFR